MAQKKKVDLGKAEQILSKSFTDNVSELSEDEIEQLIVKAQQEVRKLKLEKKNDPKLQAAKEIVSDLNKAYSSAISYSDAKSSFLLDRLEEIQNPELQD
jgi:arsenate reductase-like glutaredoxin family protein